MAHIIGWCNNNSGFVTAIFSAVGLLLSVIAIVVSIQTARLPYKKRLKLSSTVDIAFTKNVVTGEVVSETVGLSINAANTGMRDINITYLGISVKDKISPDGEKRINKIDGSITGIGLLSPAGVKTELYSKKDMLYCLNLASKKAKVFVYVLDSEGKSYHRKLGYAENLIRTLSM